MRWLFLLPFILFFSNQKSPQFYYWDGKQLEVLKTVQLPNLGSTTLRFYIKSPCKLEAVSLDSEQSRIYLPDRSDRAKFHLKGRWYVIIWQTRLSVGISHHIIDARTVKGESFIQKFSVAVEGAQKIEHLNTNH